MKAEIMNTDYAVQLINQCTYKPGHELIASDYHCPVGCVRFEVYAFGLMDSDQAEAPHYRKRINRFEDWLIDVSSLTEPEDLYACILEKLIEFEVHETREFLSVNSRYDKPFHPHTIEGQRNWSQQMKRVIQGVR